MKYSLLAIVTVLLLGCAEKRLPILGERTPVTHTVNGKEVTDTLYHTIPAFRFTDQDGQVVTAHTFEHKIYVADFFYTTCPTICPVMEGKLKRVYEHYKADPRVMLLSHSIDPAHDSVAVLKRYATGLGVAGAAPAWRFVTGAKDSIYDIAQKAYLSATVEDARAPGGFVHSGNFVLIDSGRRIRGYYDGTNDEAVDALIEDIATLLKEQIQ